MMSQHPVEIRAHAEEQDQDRERTGERLPLSDRRFGRRALLGTLAATAGGGAAAAAGVAFGYRHAPTVRALELRVRRPNEAQPEGMDDFRRQALAVFARHDLQTAESVAALKKKYEEPVFGRVRVWDLVEKLALCIDPSDMRLFCGSQLLHVQQILAGMEENGVTDPDLLLLATIHDLGKTLLLTHELPENVVCLTGRIGEGASGAGLDQVVFQFGHGEFIYSRLRGHVPERVAWAARYHNVDLKDVARFLNDQERAWTEEILIPFKRYDGGFVSPYFLPRIDMTRYRDLLEHVFPNPILV
jgi:hypothetical protein